MSIQRKFERALLCTQGRLKARKRHNPVAVRLINTNQVVFDEQQGTTVERNTFERHYLHATKGWKVDRGSRQANNKAVRQSFSTMLRIGQPAIVATRYRGIPNPKRQKVEAA